jgi:molecular chaperone DnaJ
MASGETLTIPRDPESEKKTSTTSNKASDHKNEGFLKSAWHRLTHQHDNLEPDESPKSETKSESKTDKDDEEPKKASGSG